MDFSLVIATLPVFLIVAAGFIMHRGGWMAPDLDSGVMQLAVRLLMPCLILDKIIGDPALDDPRNVLWAVGIGFGIIVTGLGIAMLIAPALGLGKGTGKRTFAITVAIQNYGFLALPVLISLFGDGPLGMLFLVGMGVELATWIVGVPTLRGFSGSNWREAITGPVVAVLLGLALHYGHGDNWIPQPLRSAISTLGSCAVPMCLFMIGATISGQMRPGESALRWPTTLGACVLRLAVFPAGILSLTALLPLSVELKQVLLVQAAMPSAVFPIILARLYGGHPPTAIQIVAATTLASIVTMPLILTFGRAWLNL